MKIQNKIENTLKIVETLEDVNVSPFFKDKTLQRLFLKKEVETNTIWSWFTPQLQFACLACLLIINVYTIYQVKNANYSDSISVFATDYGIHKAIDTSIFNF